jgi:serine/threonine protein kinase
MKFRRRQRLGQYRIERKLSEGAYAFVYCAYDTVEGIRVALKLPLADTNKKDSQAAFRREVRVVAQLDHPNILPIKTAGVIDSRFVIVTPLGIESLADRLGRRMARATALDFAEQILRALAFAHRRRIAHLDVKPENLILFPDRRLRLADFGLARFVRRPLAGSGSGTVGYVAPEQALGRPSLRSDVFSAALVIWRMLSGKVPQWPYRWPLAGAEAVERRFHPALIRLLRRAMQVDETKRFSSAEAMLKAFERLREKDQLAL